MTNSRTITIVAHDGNSFDIFEGERYLTRLTWDEMLGEVASLTHPRILTSRYCMRTAEEYEAARQHRREMALRQMDVISRGQND